MICYKRHVSRKYKQSGYQEDGERQGRRDSGSTRDRSDGPRGRGLGAPTASSSRCARCGATTGAAVSTESVCAECGSDLHSCTNCRHFDSSARYECREAIPERLAGKAKGNSCESFAVKIVKGFATESATKSDDPKAAFDALFDL